MTKLERLAELVLLDKMAELAYHRQQHSTNQARQAGELQWVDAGEQVEFALLEWTAQLHEERDLLLRELLEEWTALDPLEFRLRLEAVGLPPIPVRITDLISAGKSY